MGIVQKCPRCGSTRVQLTDQKSKHGCVWFVLFGIFYICWIMIKWIIGIMIFILWDWWMAIIKASMHKGYVWHSKQWFITQKRMFYCHDCGYNFKA